MIKDLCILTFGRGRLSNNWDQLQQNRTISKRTVFYFVFPKLLLVKISPSLHPQKKRISNIQLFYLLNHEYLIAKGASAAPSEVDSQNCKIYERCNKNIHVE